MNFIYYSIYFSNDILDCIIIFCRITLTLALFISSFDSLSKFSFFAYFFISISVEKLSFSLFSIIFFLFSLTFFFFSNSLVTKVICSITYSFDHVLLVSANMLISSLLVLILDLKYYHYFCSLKKLSWY